MAQSTLKIETQRPLHPYPHANSLYRCFNKRTQWSKTRQQLRPFSGRIKGQKEDWEESNSYTYFFKKFNDFLQSSKKISICLFLAVLGLHCCACISSGCSKQGLFSRGVHGLLIALTSPLQSVDLLAPQHVGSSWTRD